MSLPGRGISWLLALGALQACLGEPEPAVADVTWSLTRLPSGHYRLQGHARLTNGAPG